MDNTYKVVFTGKLCAGFRLDDVVANLVAMTNMDEEKARKFLTAGRPTVVKKGVEREEAEALGDRLSKGGLQVQVVRLENESRSGVEPTPQPAVEAWPEPPEVPYASPEADLEAEEKEGCFLEAPQKVAASHGWRWITSAVAMFIAEPWKWMAMVVVAGLLTVLCNLVPFIGSFGAMLLGAVLGGGMMMAARDQQLGRPLTVNTLFRGFSHNRNQLLLVGTFYLCVWLVFGLISIVVMGASFLSIFSFGGGDPQSIPGALAGSISIFFVLMLILAALSIPLMMAYWFATPLVALADRTAWNAYKQSFSACLINWLPFLVYGLAFLVLGTLAMLVFAAVTGLTAFFLSGSDSRIMAVIPTMALAMLLGIPCMAVVGLSLYTGFRDIFQRSA